MKQDNSFLSGMHLKIIALVSMLLDHVGAALILPGLQGVTGSGIYLPDELIRGVRAGFFGTDVITYNLLRYLGRTAFPLYAFLLVEGFFCTRSRLRYAARVAVFALISEVPFDLAFYGRPFEWCHQNTLFELLLGLFVLIALDKLLVRLVPGTSITQKTVLVSLSAGTVGISMYLAALCHFDYGWSGILAIVVIYVAGLLLPGSGSSADSSSCAALRARNVRILVFGISALILHNPLELLSLPAVIPIMFYNGTRGGRALPRPLPLLRKYFFYAFYPLHLLLLALISLT